MTVSHRSIDKAVRHPAGNEIIQEPVRFIEVLQHARQQDDVRRKAIPVNYRRVEGEVLSSGLSLCELNTVFLSRGGKEALRPQSSRLSRHDVAALEINALSAYRIG